MRKLKRIARRQLLRSFRATSGSLVHELQTITIVFLAVLAWMLWAILTFGTVPAFFLTVPTSLPALAWLDRRRVWIDRLDERAERRLLAGGGRR